MLLKIHSRPSRELAVLGEQGQVLVGADAASTVVQRELGQKPLLMGDDGQQHVSAGVVVDGPQAGEVGREVIEDGGSSSSPGPLAACSTTCRARGDGSQARMNASRSVPETHIRPRTRCRHPGRPTGS